ncbi:CBS domain-containing protein [Thalassotalea marina]|uniref:CBS domain-containing protein n=1 Tax=Thalassotalea marina TaxID=1673741 RepID=A0A919BAW6_9GAMM|nr:CBS domain-containing protein [Thalassotalea marina]GHF79709.1 CBS domain-containing protein [Thalassotalea marina]
MNQPISDIMQKNVIVAHIEDTIQEIEQFLAQNHLSFLPIIDDQGKCFGVISDYDLLKFHKDMGNSQVEHAWEICSHAIIEVTANTPIFSAAELLVSKKIHHLVITEQDKVEGVVSATDLLRYFMDIKPLTNK